MENPYLRYQALYKEREEVVENWNDAIEFAELDRAIRYAEQLAELERKSMETVEKIKEHGTFPLVKKEIDMKEVTLEGRITTLGCIAMDVFGTNEKVLPSDWAEEAKKPVKDSAIA